MKISASDSAMCRAIEKIRDEFRKCRIHSRRTEQGEFLAMKFGVLSSLNQLSYGELRDGFLIEQGSDV
jgi:hypothetical protein